MGFGSDKTGFYKPSAVTVTATGNPLTLQNAKRLRKLTIYGNAVQDGTPSPDAPVEVQLCGDRTGNLFDNSSLVVGRSFSGGGVGTIWRYNSLAIKMSTDKIYIKPSTSYSIITYNNDVYWRDRIIEADTNDICTVNHAQYTVDNSYDQSKNIKIYNFTTKSNTDYIVVRFQRVDGADITSSDVNELKCMLVEGSYTADTLPAYEPYGYKVSGRVEGLNLFNEKDFGAQTGVITNDDGSFTLPNKYTFTYDIRVESNSTYTLKTISNHQEPYGNMMLRFLNEDKQEVSQVYLRSNNSPYVLQTGNINYIRISGTWSIRYTITFKNFQIVQGSYTAETMPPYEPYQPPQDFAVYLPEQIAKVGDVADEVVVDFEKQTAELRKNVGSVVADGEENWFRGGNQYDTADYTNRYSNFYDIRGNSETPGYFSNRFERKLGGMWNNPNSEAFNINNNQLHLTISNTRLGITADDEASDRTTKFKAWLNDNNVTVYAPLATPVTTDITSLQQWDAMPQVSGTVTLTLSAEVEPSGAEAVYTVTKRPKAQAHGADAVR